jgi:hypothetical protein
MMMIKMATNASENEVTNDIHMNGEKRVTCL